MGLPLRPDATMLRTPIPRIRICNLDCAGLGTPWFTPVARPARGHRGRPWCGLRRRWLRARLAVGVEDGCSCISVLGPLPPETGTGRSCKTLVAVRSCLLPPTKFAGRAGRPAGAGVLINAKEDSSVFVGFPLQPTAVEFANLLHVSTPTLIRVWPIFIRSGCWRASRLGLSKEVAQQG